MSCKPKSFSGSGEAITLMQGFVKTESIFEICACPEGSKLKFVACTFSNMTLTWWNHHVKSLTLTVANSMSWENLKAMMIEEYRPRAMYKS